MKQLLLKHGQGILTKEQKEFIIETGKMPKKLNNQIIEEDWAKKYF